MPELPVREGGVEGVLECRDAAREINTPAAFPSQGLPLDVNADGKGDLVFAASGTISVALNTSSSTTPSFANRVDFAARGTPFAIGDIDKNGKPDVIGVVTNAVAVSLNTTATMATTPTFAAPASFAVPNAADVQVADLNGDGHLDLVVAAGSKLSILLSQ